MATLGPGPLPAEGLLFLSVALPQTLGPAQVVPVGLLLGGGGVPPSKIMGPAPLPPITLLLGVITVTSDVVFRRTLSPIGTRVGSRQAMLE